MQKERVGEQSGTSKVTLFAGDHKEGTEWGERRKMLEREQVTHGTKTQCWGWRKKRVGLLFFLSRQQKTYFCIDLSCLKNQPLQYHVPPTWDGTGKSQLSNTGPFSEAFYFNNKMLLLGSEACSCLSRRRAWPGAPLFVTWLYSFIII